jgi:hypothetical protein
MVDIPDAPGVPNLPDYSPNPVVLLFADAISSILSFFSGGPTGGWGIFLNGGQAFPYNSVIDFDFKQDYTLADEPIEEGSFVSYDKVQHPFDVRMRVASGPSPSDRQALLVAARAAAADLNLYTVVTPEDVYDSCNITHVDWKRSSDNGVGIVVVDFWFQEIRQSATSTLSNTQSPTTAGAQSAGNVAPVSNTSSGGLNNFPAPGTWN